MKNKELVMKVFHEELSKIAASTYEQHMQSNFPQEGGSSPILPAAAGVAAGAVGYKYLAGKKAVAKPGLLRRAFKFGSRVLKGKGKLGLIAAGLGTAATMGAKYMKNSSGRTAYRKAAAGAIRFARKSGFRGAASKYGKSTFHQSRKAEILNKVKKSYVRKASAKRFGRRNSLRKRSF